MKQTIKNIKGFKIVIVFLLFFYSCAAFPATKVSKYAVSPSSVVILEENAATQRVPASILKIISSQLALDKWGEDYRFETDFYLHDGWLWVKGKGDPFFVSEEMDLFIVDLLNQYPELSELKGIGIDGSYFSDVKVNGRDGKNDPYNAPLSAVATNFNTVFIKKYDQGILSAETQTPLTATARHLASQLSHGKHRINVGNVATAETYFGELLRAKLNAVGVTVDNRVKRGVIPIEAELIMVYKNSRTLSEILRGALEYSNNFISNMLFIQLCERAQAHSMADARLCAEQQLQNNYPVIFNNNDSQNESTTWHIVDGAGLSRKNRISAQQMVAMLAMFAPHKHLMKIYHQGRVHAKTGTLHGVRSFAGYIATSCGDVRFAFLFEGQSVYKKREQALGQLIRNMDKKNNASICN